MILRSRNSQSLQSGQPRTGPCPELFPTDTASMSLRQQRGCGHWTPASHSDPETPHLASPAGGLHLRAHFTAEGATRRDRHTAAVRLGAALYRVWIWSQNPLPREPDRPRQQADTHVPILRTEEAREVNWHAYTFWALFFSNKDFTSPGNTLVELYNRWLEGYCMYYL